MQNCKRKFCVDILIRTVTVFMCLFLILSNTGVQAYALDSYKLEDADSPELYLWLTAKTQQIPEDLVLGLMTNIAIGQEDTELKSWAWEDNALLTWIQAGDSSVFAAGFGDNADYKAQVDFLLKLLVIAGRADGVLDASDDIVYDSLDMAALDVYVLITGEYPMQSWLEAYLDIANAYSDKYSGVECEIEQYEFYDEASIRNEMVEIAESQLGHVGGLPYAEDDDEPWCTEFAVWCANQVGGVHDELVPDATYSGALKRWFDKRGQWYDADSGYLPLPGDIILYDWDGDGSTDHTGVVEEVDSKRVYTIEGNVGNKCRRQSHSIDAECIAGYCVPEY